MRCLLAAWSTRARAVAASLSTLTIALVVTACAPLDPPRNTNIQLFDPEKSSRLGHRQTLSYMQNTCPPAGTADFIMPPSRNVAAKSLNQMSMRYSPGDRFHVFVFGSQDFSGDYAINADGTVVLPYAGAVEAVGLTNSELTQRIEASYVKAGVFLRDGLKLTTRPIQYAPVNVSITGAVFMPGRQSINAVRDSDKLDKAMTKFGDSPMERFVGAALRAGGGVRPDADLSRVKLTRNGRSYMLDWRGAITGAPVDDMPLIEGDHIDVGESGCFQSALVRVSQITPPAIRFFVSNLASPVLNNSVSANPQFATILPYGTRFLQGLVQANCVGGNLATNASRYAVLISRNPKTRETEVVQRSIEELVRSADRDKINPYLMPDDAIACYDGAVQEVKDVMSTLTQMLTPFQIGKSIR